MNRRDFLLGSAGVLIAPAAAAQNEGFAEMKSIRPWKLISEWSGGMRLQVREVESGRIIYDSHGEVKP